MEASLQHALKMRCPYFYELEKAMGDRASSKPLADENDFELLHEEDSSREAEEIKEDKQKDEDAFKTPSKRTSSSSSKPRSLLLTKRSKATSNDKVMTTMRAEMLVMKKEQITYENKYRLIEMHLKEQEAELRERELKSKLRLEDMQMKKIEEEIEMAKINRRVHVLQKRKELIEQGVPEADIDVLLPLIYSP